MANNITMTVAKNSAEVAITPSVTGTFTGLSISTLAVNGFARAGDDLQLYYRPASDYSGSDTFAYAVSSDDGTSAPATVTITVNPALPIAKSSTSTVAANSQANALTLSLSGGPCDSLTILTPATNGTLEVAGASVSYTPTAGYHGTDSFSYAASNAGGTSQTATVTITITQPPPVANDISVSVTKNSGSNSITPNVTGTFRSVVKASDPAHGTAWTTNAKTMLAYTPSQDYSGSDSFTYTATNDGGTSAPATVYVTVGLLAPAASSNQVSVAANSSAQPITLQLSGGAATQLSITSTTTHGTLVVTGSAITYTPAAGYSGTDAFTYTAKNASGSSSPATVSISVTAPTLLLAPASLATATAGMAYSQILSASLGTTPYGYAVASGSLPAGMSLHADTGEISGLPASDSVFSFSIQATDAYGATGLQTYALTVVSQAPAAHAIDLDVAANSGSNTVTLNLADSSITSVAIADQPAHGTATSGGLSISYTPDAGYSGTDSFTYTATNAAGTSTPATVTLTVAAPVLLLAQSTATSQTPSATPSTETAAVGITYSMRLSASRGTAPYTYALVSGSLPAGLSLDTSTGEISGMPTDSGSFSFTIQATDIYQATGSQTYALTVANRPSANPFSTSVAANSEANLIDLTPYLKGGSLTHLSITPPAHGTAVVSGLDSILYTPLPGFSGSDAFDYVASNAYGDSSATVEVSVTPPLLLMAPSSLSDGSMGAAYAQQLSTSLGMAPYGYSLSSGSLPQGLSLSNSGLLGGTPTESGSFYFLVTVTDSCGASNWGSYALNIRPQVPAVENSTLTVLANSTDNPVPLSITGGTPLTLILTQAAAHGSIVITGLSITYTPNSSYWGPDAFAYKASNDGGTSPAAQVSITVTPPQLQLLPETLAAAATGESYRQGVFATQGTAPYVYALITGGLPPGLSLSPGTGTISGTPTQAGSFAFTLEATDATGFSVSRDYTLAVTTLPPQAVDLTVNIAANSKSNAIDLQPAVLQATNLNITTAASHGEVVIDASTLSLSYTPNPGFSGTDSFSYTLGNAGGSTTATVTIKVAAPTLTLEPALLLQGTAGTPYQQQLSADLGTPPYAYVQLSGSLPPGISLGSDGELRGTPTAYGSFIFKVQATDSLQATGSRTFTLFVAIQAPLAGDSSLEVQANSSDNPVQLQPAGGAAASVEVARQAAHGTALSSGIAITYTPTAGYSGTDSFTYTLTNDSGTSAQATVTVTILPPTLAIAPSSLPPGIVGTAYGQHLSARLGTAPYAYRLESGSLPPGLSLAPSGLLGGMPSANASFDFTARATDAYGATGLQRYALAIAIQAPAAGPVSLSVPANSQNNPVALNLSGGAVASAAVTVQALHGTATASGTTISYTPTAGYSGEDAFTYTVVNASGTSSARVTVTVTGPVLSIAPAAGALPHATEGTAYSQSLTASGGTAPYAYALSSGALPAGLSLSAGGQISGTPQLHATGSFSFSIGVSDVYQGTGAASYTLRVSQMQPVAPSLSVTLAPSSSLELDLSSSATGGPFTKADLLSLSPADAGQASIQSSSSAQAPGAPVYMLRFTSSRNFSGTATLAYTLSNTAGTSAPARISIQVLARSDPGQNAEVTALVAAQTNSARRFASAQVSNFTSRLEGLHGDGWGRSSFGLSLDTGNQPATAGQTYGREDLMPGNLPPPGMHRTSLRPEPLRAEAMPGDLPSLPGGAAVQGHPQQAFAFWTAGSVSYGREHLHGMDTDYRFTTSGISAGADWRISDLATLGLGLGLGRDSSLVGQNGSKSAASSVSAVLYGSLRPARHLFVDGLLGYGRLSFDSTRFISEESGTATGTRQGSQVFGALIAGMEFRETGWLWSPYARLELSRTTLNTYSESASGFEALTYYAQTASALAAVLGLRLEGNYALGAIQLSPKIRLEYTHSLQRSGDAGLAYSDLADLGPAYTLSGSSSRTRNWALGLGLRLRWRSGLELSLEINTSRDIGNSHSQGLLLGLRLPF
ncbi:Ig-like domain-containing protein [Comamonas composti]|uniref:Ig-like domain-containing protein n=1 Tax=Comamonas composti TaxID=408558 RepID=UPI00387E1535